MDDNAAVAGDFGDALLQMIERNISRFVNMLSRPLARISDISNSGGFAVANSSATPWGADAFGRPHYVGRLSPEVCALATCPS
jgi:hypothetical protein